MEHGGISLAQDCGGVGIPGLLTATVSLGAVFDGTIRGAAYDDIRSRVT